MEIIVSLISLWVFIKNISYAIYEFNINKNIVGSLVVAILNCISFIFINIMLLIN